MARLSRLIVDSDWELVPDYKLVFLADFTVTGKWLEGRDGFALSIIIGPIDKHLIVVGRQVRRRGLL